MIEIKRDVYLQQLTMRKDNGMIKVITGIRRCGKSFLLYRKDRLWRSLELKNARTEAGTTTRRFLD